MALVLSDENNEKKIHQNSIEILAKKLRKATIGEVALIYTSVLNDLQKRVRVKIFLHILVSKKVKELIG
jgi:hypothetical protein